MKTFTIKFSDDVKLIIIASSKEEALGKMLIALQNIDKVTFEESE